MSTEPNNNKIAFMVMFMPGQHFRTPIFVAGIWDTDCISLKTFSESLSKLLLKKGYLIVNLYCLYMYCNLNKILFPLIFLLNSQSDTKGVRGRCFPEPCGCRGRGVCKQMFDANAIDNQYSQSVTLTLGQQQYLYYVN